jgi:hypothetical protein
MRLKSVRITGSMPVPRPPKKPWLSGLFLPRAPSRQELPLEQGRAGDAKGALLVDNA